MGSMQDIDLVSATQFIHSISQQNKELFNRSHAQIPSLQLRHATTNENDLFEFMGHFKNNSLLGEYEQLSLNPCFSLFKKIKSLQSASNISNQESFFEWVSIYYDLAQQSKDQIRIERATRIKSQVEKLSSSIHEKRNALKALQEREQQKALQHDSNLMLKREEQEIDKLEIQMNKLTNLVTEAARRSGSQSSHHEVAYV